ncbi:uncharacterized protein LOC127132115 [Lathyrus oleraceus]|uniref:Acid phosphatase/vanadium-dependent haloperoxidase-related protein n=1 Tax=Pisum sativum TaxID=3888 RepID=A0A9D5ATH6_PEA|nr:uncharacterized protein LOC127132115 [Pisum sativum]KAI5423787.1 hypothetical protein KIW84_030138 [Pisum sativum]
MDSLFPLTLKLQSSFHPLFHFNTLTPIFTTSCSSHQSQSNTTTSSHNSQPNPSSVSFPFAHIIKKVAALTTHNRVSNENQQGSCYLQNGGLGVALLSITANAKVKISPFVATLASNPTFVSGLFAWFVAQSIKVFLNFCMERKWDLRLMFASGGMPSSHSALCTALTTSVALSHGVADSLFPVSLGFTLIVMYDAIGVRRHAGMQAQVLNMIVADMFQGHPISERKLKELLGHTPSQVFAGALLGCLVACLCCKGCVLVG